MRALGSDILVLASHNAGKLREIKALLESFGISARPVSGFSSIEPDETGTSFAENARIKAHAAAAVSGLPALSDDSGLAVDALDGAPGVYTADWAETGNGRDFAMAMGKVNAQLEGMNAPHPRTARFCCTLCVAWPDGHDEIFEGQVRGHLVWPMRGTQGFGYDPVFVAVGETETFGEMDPVRKHAMSHRADAFAKLKARLLAR